MARNDVNALRLDANRGGNNRETNTSDLNTIQQILDKTLHTKVINGTVDIDELQATFERDRGRTLAIQDGYYRVTGLHSPLEGNLVRITTTPEGKTLWYPTGVAHLAEVVAKSQGEIKRIVFEKLLDDIQRSKARGAEDGELRDYLAQEEAKRAGEYQIVDFGSGDGRLLMVAAACGMPAVGIETDQELSEMAHANIAASQKSGVLKTSAEMVTGSFFDEKVLKDVLNKTQALHSICYLYITPYTWDLIPRLLPHLESGDVIVTYKERLSLSPKYAEVERRIKKKDEFFLMEPQINTYTLK